MKIRASILVLLALTGCQQKPFAEYSNADGKFRTVFPGEPKVTATSAAGIVVKMYSVETWNKAYMIGWADLPIPTWETEGRTKSRLFDARDGALAAIKGTSNGVTTTIQLIDRFPGIEFGGTSDGKHIRARAYLVGHRMYRILIVAGSTEHLNSPEAEEFFAAFQVLEPDSLLPPGSPAAVVAAEAKEVKERGYPIESTNGRFVAKYPEKPKKFTKKIGSDEFTGYACDSANGACSVSYADLPIPGGESAEKVRERLEAAKNAALAELQATATSSKDITIGSGIPGQEFEGTAGEKQIRGRVYLVGARLFQITVVGSAQFVEAKENAAFLGSFQLK